MSRRWWSWARPLGGAAIVAVLLHQVGTEPFLDAARMIDGWSLAAAAGISALTTVCCAWRWSLVARGLGLGLPLHVAIAAYYRSQFLNTTLPGGVLGDVSRAVRHGRAVGDTARGLRAVVWERSAGQAVQVLLTLAVLLLMPSPMRAYVPVVATAVVAVACGGVLLSRALARSRPSPVSRAVRAAAADLRAGVLGQRAWPRIVLASGVAVSGHAVAFLIAARAAGATAPTVQMLPLALLVLLAMGVPANIAGWGPREGVAAWAFGVAGLSAAQGVSAAVVYGVMVLVASLPGAGVLIAGWLHHDARGTGTVTERSGSSGPEGSRLEGAARA